MNRMKHKFTNIFIEYILNWHLVDFNLSMTANKVGQLIIVADSVDPLFLL